VTDNPTGSNAWITDPQTYLDHRAASHTVPSAPLSRYLAMRHGVRLAVDIHLPQGEQPAAGFPAIRIFTPYSRRFHLAADARAGIEPSPNSAAYRQMFVQHGYALVVVDVRGTGASFGVVAGYFGGRVDMVANFIITTRLSMPVVLVALAVVSMAGSSLTVVIWVLGLLIWDRFAVVMRSATMQVRNLDFVASAQALGCSTARIVLTEILPNVANHLIVVATIEMAHAILLEAALSFLGLGVQPPEPSWGLMISEAKGLMFFDAWLIAIPGTALFLLVLSINLLGDGLRDVTAPDGRN
jgi:Binding-protein-dependent transport system inner membrane component/X-Pro dipeptidyl-peptidase (S15 family)